MKKTADVSFKMTKSQEETFKGLCDYIGEQLETERGKEIVSRTVKRLRISITDICRIVNEQNVKEMLILHVATLPVLEALFGEKARLNPMTLIFNMATTEIIEMIEDRKQGGGK